ncbi:MAG: DUF4384 domain-containing protein [Pseudomonadota bacterium]
MKPGAASWTVSAVLSVTVHASGAALLLALLPTDPVEQGGTPESALALDTLNVPRSAASQASPQIETANPGGLSSDSLGTRPIPKSIVNAGALEAVSPATSTPEPTDLPALTASGVALNDIGNQSTNIAPAALTEAKQLIAQTGANTDARPLPLNRFRSETTLQEPLTIETPNSALPTETTTPQSTTGFVPKATNLTALAARARTETPNQPTLAPQRAVGATALENAPKAAKLRSSPVTSEATSPVLAWSGTLTVAVEQDVLEAAAALRLPTAGAAGLRDALSARLTDVECARVQTAYDPETGSVDLLGHVRDEADRARLVSSISTQLNDALPVKDRLQRLASPQCDVLVQLADMPLPQSVEQFRNPLIIGADLQVRNYTFQSGQSMFFELAGADYDGWLYLDYYDSNGQVLHLAPNEFITPFVIEAEQRLVFGDGSDQDPAKGKFELRVSPPFGQDIAVAMVASEPLFDVSRPLVEPAAPYLDALLDRLENLRQTKPDFKGEWIYLFVTTEP